MPTTNNEQNNQGFIELEHPSLPPKDRINQPGMNAADVSDADNVANPNAEDESETMAEDASRGSGIPSFNSADDLEREPLPGGGELVRGEDPKLLDREDDLPIDLMATPGKPLSQRESSKQKHLKESGAAQFEYGREVQERTEHFEFASDRHRKGNPDVGDVDLGNIEADKPAEPDDRDLFD